MARAVAIRPSPAGVIPSRVSHTVAGEATGPHTASWHNVSISAIASATRGQYRRNFDPHPTPVVDRHETALGQGWFDKSSVSPSRSASSSFPAVRDHDHQTAPHQRLANQP